jgi:hypothetical protein
LLGSPRPPVGDGVEPAEELAVREELGRGRARQLPGFVSSVRLRHDHGHEGVAVAPSAGHQQFGVDTVLAAFRGGLQHECALGKVVTLRNGETDQKSSDRGIEPVHLQPQTSPALLARNAGRGRVSGCRDGHELVRTLFGAQRKDKRFLVRLRQYVSASKGCHMKPPLIKNQSDIQ